MPRKYEPCIRSDEYSFGYWSNYADMRESPDGKWVPLQVFIDTTAQLRAENQRLKRLLNTIYNGDSNA